MSLKHDVKFFPSGRGKAQCPSDPNHPYGVYLNLFDPRACCKVSLPYPAPECGAWVVTCNKCHVQIMVTAAGWPDDPVSVRIPCEVNP